VQHLVIWITFAGAMITSRENRHLSLSAWIDLLKNPRKKWIQSLTSCIATAITTGLTWSSFSFVQVGFEDSQHVGIFPIRILMLIMPAGFAFMTLRFIFHVPKGVLFYCISLSGIGIAALFGFVLHDFMSVLIWPCSIVLFAAALFGAPIFTILGGYAILLFINSGGTTVVIPNEAYTMLTSPAIPAIPLFTLAGFILSESKAGDRLVQLFRVYFGWLPGGLAIATILICTFFTALTGASGVTILALGGLLSFILLENKYKSSFTTGLLTVNGIGTLFPPSLPLIMYGVVAHINIKKMFVGGLLPGTLMILALVIYVIVTAKKENITSTPLNIHELFPAVKGCIGEILLPFVIILFYFKGITTLVETGAITVVYVLLITTVFNRDIAFKELPTVFLKSIPIIGGVLIILAVAKGLSYFIVDAEVPMILTEWMQKFIRSKYLFLLILNIILLITGCFMDVFSAIMVLVPLIIPLGEAYDVHPVHLGIIFLANLEVGYLTPPIGLNLFLSSFRFNKPLVKIYKYIIPFLVVMILSVLVITYIPWVTTVLPGVFGFD
jgi:tripartite ATP-independent transporter DctM subunit